MLPTTRSSAFTVQSIADYQTLAATETALPPTLGDFLALLGPEGKGRHPERQAALAAAIRCLQAGHPARESIQLWLLVSYTRALQSLVRRYAPHGADPAETESTVVLAFLEVLGAMSAERLADPYLEKRVMDDAKDRLRVHLGLRDYQREDDVEVVEDDALQEDRMPDERSDGYQALMETINDLPISDEDRAMLIGLHVYGYNLAELAQQMGMSHEAARQRHHRILQRARKMSTK